MKKDSLHFQEELDNEINEQRFSQGKKPIKKKEEYKRKKVSTTDPDSGYYVKGEHEK
ncbi:hypothetical protein [Staphylococcus equorum]|uniref:hypothetical protein n=1 Tax=Staphylococcus equorum TaxID=246432 RepID=UPI0018C8B9E3|nr:hypothetical protein [Staphylococcus equorum]